MPSTPKYSILIPTRNGLRYLSYAIDSVLSQPSTDFELVISDNHSSDGTAEFLRGLNDPRVRILRPATELPMTAHFEFVLSHATGDWVTALGDDDALMPFFFAYLESLDLDKIAAPAIVFRRAYYFWEGCEELYGDAVVGYCPSSRAGYVSNSKALFLALCSVSDYFQMPQTYATGLIRNSFIQKIKKQSGGRFFYATAPDAASAAILAIHARYHYRIEQPIFWTGTSPKSVGYSQGSGVHKDRSIEFERQNKSLRLSNSLSIPLQVREIFDVSVVLYDALLSCPHVPKFWTSRIMRNFFIAGLITNKKRLKRSVLAAYDVSERSLYPFTFLLKILRSIHKSRAMQVDRGRKKSSLNSKDRARFATIKQASDAVLELEDKYISPSIKSQASIFDSTN